MSLMRLANNQSRTSAAHRMRRRRFSFFLSLLDTVPRPLRILDAGGDPAFWRAMGFEPSSQVRITLLNIDPLPEVAGFDVLTADVRSMDMIRDREYDVVFSNSMIEHVGSKKDQERAAAEIRRVGRRYFVQTPNRYFPLEPHFLVPGFQFLPVPIRAGLLTVTDLGWIKRAPDYETARDVVTQIRLLTRHEMTGLFPDARLYTERIGPLAKSFVCYGGWSEDEADAAVTP